MMKIIFCISYYQLIHKFQSFVKLMQMIVKQLKMKQKNKKEGFLVLLGTLGASLLGNLLTGKNAIRSGEGIVEAG